MKASNVLCYNEELLFICVVLLLLLYCIKDTDFCLKLADGATPRTSNDLLRKQLSSMQLNKAKICW